MLAGTLENSLPRTYQRRGWLPKDYQWRSLSAGPDQALAHWARSRWRTAADGSPPIELGDLARRKSLGESARSGLAIAETALPRFNQRVVIQIEKVFEILNGSVFLWS